MFWKNIGKMSIIPIIITFCGMWINSGLDVETWGALILCVLIYAGIYSAGMYCIVMNDYEKDVVRKPLNKFFVKIGIRRV